jgi:hypothetical protein
MQHFLGNYKDIPITTKKFRRPELCSSKTRAYYGEALIQRTVVKPKNYHTKCILRSKCKTNKLKCNVNMIIIINDIIDLD